MSGVLRNSEGAVRPLICAIYGIRTMSDSSKKVYDHFHIQYGYNATMDNVRDVRGGVGYGIYDIYLSVIETM